MIAVILAAGRGRRLGSDRPKGLLEFGGRTLIARHLDNLAGVAGEIARAATEKLIGAAPGGAAVTAALARATIELATKEKD